MLSQAIKSGPKMPLKKEALNFSCDGTPVLENESSFNESALSKIKNESNQLGLIFTQFLWSNAPSHLFFFK